MPTDLKWRQNKRGGRKSRCKPLKRQASLPLRAHTEVRSQKIGRFGHQVACAHPLNAICRTCRELGRARGMHRAVHSSCAGAPWFYRVSLRHHAAGYWRPAAAARGKRQSGARRECQRRRDCGGEAQCDDRSAHGALLLWRPRACTN